MILKLVDMMIDYHTQVINGVFVLYEILAFFILLDEQNIYQSVRSNTTRSEQIGNNDEHHLQVPRLKQLPTDGMYHAFLSFLYTYIERQDIISSFFLSLSFLYFYL
jgi:hypothetical protein